MIRSLGVWAACLGVLLSLSGVGSPAVAGQIKDRSHAPVRSPALTPRWLQRTLPALGLERLAGGMVVPLADGHEGTARRMSDEYEAATGCRVEWLSVTIDGGDRSLVAREVEARRIMLGRFEANPLVSGAVHVESPSAVRRGHVVHLTVVAGCYG